MRVTEELHRPGSFTLPLLSTMTLGQSIYIANGGTGPLTLARQGTDLIGAAQQTTVVVNSGCAVQYMASTAIWAEMSEIDYVGYRYEDLRIAPSFDWSVPSAPSWAIWAISPMARVMWSR